jgi:flagellar biosynthesis GTPase FlhF
MSLISSVALSLIGFAVSKCVGSSDLSDAFFSELGVGSFGDIFKDGSELALAKFFKGASNYNKDQLNHDLNKAARKSLLLATWFACRGVLLEYNYDNAKKQEKKWIAKLADSLKDKVNKSLDEVPQTSLKETDVLIIFNSQNTQAEIETNLTSKLQEEIYDIIRTDQPSFSLYTQSGFELLKNSIESGWTEQATPTSPEYHYNWFSLVCGIFNDECKTPRIEAALQNKLFKNLFIKLGEFGKSFDLLSKEITDFRNENYQQHKYTHRKLDEINTTIKSIKESFARNSKWEIIDKEFLRKISNNYSKNDAKLFFNIREPSWGDANSEFISKRKSVSEIKEKIENKINAQQPSIIQIIGNSGEGKSTIFYQSICELINTNLNLHILFPKFDDNDLEFSELFPLINSHENYLIALDNSNKF